MLLTFIATGATAIVIRDRGPSHRKVFCQNRLRRKDLELPARLRQSAPSFLPPMCCSGLVYFLNIFSS